MSTQNPLIGLYQLNLLSEKPGLLGAPVFHSSLLVNPSANAVSGQVYISQSVTPQAKPVLVHVTGTVHEMAFGPQVTKVIVLSGQYVVSVPPPAIGSYLQHFQASIVFHGNDWATGSGNFHWGNQTDLSVPTHKI